MDASDPGVGGAADAGEPIWDWGNLLDLVVQDDDPLLLPWDDAAVIGAADPTEAAAPPPLPAPLPQQQVEPEPELESEAGPVLPPPPLRVQGIGRRVRKRDPRLVCPNYLAGRVPCACPEVDEMVVAAEVEDVATEFLAGARKKTKTAARRGKAAAAGGGGVAGGTMRAAAMEMKCQVPGCEADIRELKGYHRRHRVCLRCAHVSAVMLDGVQKRYCQQCGKFHVLLDFDEDKRSCRRKLERHNKRRRRKPDSKGILDKEIDEQLDLSADVSGDGELREENMEGTTSEVLETVLSNKVLDRGTPAGSEDVLSSPTCTQSGLQNEQSKSVVTFAASVEACIDAKEENAKLTTSSPMHDTKSAYSSSCPTGRISFKLYDWNPAEFPRRLRHQIFEWLASMPVELEGYIRPGCTILTVFVAMPQHMWDKLSDDAANLLRNLVNSPNSLLLGKGAFFIHVNNMIFQVLKDGATLTSTRLDIQSPRIDYVHPTWFEAGKPVELILCGSSLDQPKFRSLLSFDGNYLTHDCCRLTSHDTFNCVENGDLIRDSQHEIFRINITQSRPDIHGPAFVEVENMFGLSNFVPILFGSKQLCSELERIQDALCGSSNMDNIMGSEVLSNLERGRLEDHVTSFLGYVCHARNIVDHRAKNYEKTQTATRWISVGSPDQPSLGTYSPLANDNTGTGGDNNLHSANGASEEETVPLVTRDVGHRNCCQPDMNARWLKSSLVVKYPGGATRMRLGMTMVVAAVLCFTACLVLVHPHGVGVLAAPVKRYLSSDSAS
ncbi:hypothetical protein HU200_008151 [Digitaria exilis]|uniref:SBP-type domain-containing protein n=1 Tax=Digitaria exilis TaxID=1010633 RepID=A0A835FLV7_9POAL|nr:hypothetical protein HU200_008151 [Digitaria exilis]